MAFRRSVIRFNQLQSTRHCTAPQPHHLQLCNHANWHNHNVHGHVHDQSNCGECGYYNEYVPCSYSCNEQAFQTQPEHHCSQCGACTLQSAPCRCPPSYHGHCHQQHAVRPPSPPQPEAASQSTAAAPTQSSIAPNFAGAIPFASAIQNELLNDIRDKLVNMEKEMVSLREKTKRICRDAQISDDDEDEDEVCMKSEKKKSDGNRPSQANLKRSVDDGQVLWQSIVNDRCCKRDISRQLKVEQGAVQKALQRLCGKRYLSVRGKGYGLRSKYKKENVEENMDEFLHAIRAKYGSFCADQNGEADAPNTSATSDEHRNERKRNRDKEEADTEEPPPKKHKAANQVVDDGGSKKQKQKQSTLTVSEVVEEHTEGIGDSNKNKNVNKDEEKNANGHAANVSTVKKYRRRKRYSQWEKMQIVREYHAVLVRNYNAKSKENVTALQEQIADRYDIDRSLVSKWYKQKHALWTFANAHSKCKKKDSCKWNSKLLRCKKRIGRIRECKYHEQEKELHDIFIARRQKGRKINKLWFKIKFKQLLERDQPDGWDEFACSDGWFCRFRKRWNVVKRKRTNKKTQDLQQREPLLKKFHVLLHSIRNDQRYEQQCIVYGRFSAENTYVFDEVPMPFIYDEETTYDTRGSDRIYVKACGAGLDKRQYTVGLTLRGAGRQHIAPLIIFRGKGDQNKCYDLKHNLHPKEVCIMFQQKAWMNTKLMVEYLRHYKRCRMNDRCFEKSWVIMDNENCHKTDSAKEYGGAAVGANALLTYTPPNCTDSVSVVDRITHLFKKYVCYEYEQWVEEHFEEWENQRTSAYQRRVLFSHWVLTAWNKLKVQRDLLSQMFIECGILLRRDGIDANKIHIPGLAEYRVELSVAM